MSGHSKWHSIKHKKGKEDAKRGQLFSKLSQKVMIAAREGGGNIDANTALATAVETARSYSMPMENIKRAIAKGTGELAGGQLDQLSFEGYGDGGVAIMVEAVTDNRNRTTQEVRHVFHKAGGRLGETGSVAWIFEKKGVILIPRKPEIDEDDLLELALDAGADDLKSEGDDYWEIVTDVAHFRALKEQLSEAGIEPESAELSMVPKNTVRLERDNARKVFRLVEALEDLDDVHDVYANFDVPDEIMEELAST
jgi:YebC/PmpR family DNA-binding regulatory protein